MTLGVAIQDHQSYKGTSLVQKVGKHLRIFLQVVEGGPDDTPEVRGSDRTMPYRTGQLYGPRREHRLPIVAEGWVSGVGVGEEAQRADTAAARQEIRTLFDPTSGPGTYHLETEDGVEWEIEAIPEVVVWDPPNVGVPTHRGVSIRLFAIDPPHWTATGS